eukprot:4278965-Pleurochrysis_carterae.AAC.1
MRASLRTSSQRSASTTSVNDNLEGGFKGDSQRASLRNDAAGGGEHAHVHACTSEQAAPTVVWLGAMAKNVWRPSISSAASHASSRTSSRISRGASSFTLSLVVWGAVSRAPSGTLANSRSCSTDWSPSSEVASSALWIRAARVPLSLLSSPSM